MRMALAFAWLGKLGTILALIGLGWVCSGWRPAPLYADKGMLLAQGPLVGAVSDTSATVWFRTVADAQVTVLYGTSSDLASSLTSAAHVTTPAQDHQLTIVLTDLSPNTTYFYNLTVDDVAQLGEPLPTFKTFPSPGTASDFSFGILNDFGSVGAAPAEAPLAVPTFANLAADNPAFVVIGGDFWHNDIDPVANPILSTRDYVRMERARYQAMYSHDSPQGPYNEFVDKILSHFALVHFWDDHDIGRNNADKNYFFKRQALRVLKRSFPTYPLRGKGDWQSFSYGQADFFVLDARSQRDSRFDPEGPTKSLLDGNDLGTKGQRAWLKHGLKTSQARWKIIFSPVVFNPTLHKLDAWSSYRTEHDALVRFINRNHIQGVILLSGDAHGGAIDDGTNAGLPEMLVPGPNMMRSCFTVHQIGSWTHGVYGTIANTGCRGYGLVRISTNPDRALLQVKDENGLVKLEMELAAQVQAAK